MAFAANTQSCRIFLWKKFQKHFQKYYWKLLYSNLLYSRKKYFWMYFDLKDTVSKITLKTNEIPIPDIRALLCFIIPIWHKMDNK